MGDVRRKEDRDTYWKLVSILRVHVRVGGKRCLGSRRGFRLMGEMKSVNAWQRLGGFLKPTGTHGFIDLATTTGG